MKATMTLVIELLEPALVQTREELVALDPAQVRQVSLRLSPTDPDVPGIEARADAETTSLRELANFAAGVQTEPTTVELWYRGRFEAFTL